MSDPSNMPIPSDEALVRSGIYAALARGFAPPDQETQRLPEVFAILGASFATPDATESLADRYAELFGHTTRGRVSAYETEYGPAGDLFFQPRELSDLGAFLSAFGLVLDAAKHERVDHVRCECELMAFLARKEAYALDAEDTAMLEETRKAERLFLRDHLGHFAPALGAGLRRAEPGGFYGSLGGTLQSFVEAECARFGLPAGRPDLRMNLPVLDDAPMACGSCEQPQEDCE